MTAAPPSRGLIRLLLIACGFFIALGLALALMPDSPAFAPYRDAIARRFWGGGATPPELTRLVALLFGITGGTIAGKWVMHAAIVGVALRRGQRWAWNATVAGLLSWFVVDSAVSLWRDAAFNVWMINVVPLAVLAPLLLLTRRRCTEPAPAPLPWTWWSTWMIAASAMSIVAGLVIAAGPDSPMFAPWIDGLDRAHFDGAGVPAPARELCRFLFGPIGGATVGSFVLIGLAAWRARGQRWVLIASALSILTWFTVDSACSLAAGGGFNVLLINLPTLALFAPALIGGLLATRRAAGRGST